MSLQKISTPLEAFHSSLSPSTPTSPASQLSSSHYHRDGYPSPPSEQTDYNSPPTTPSQSARARARGFSWGSSIRSSVSATSPKPRPVSVMATPSSSAAAAESDYMSGQTPAAWRHPPGVAFGNTTEVESPGRYYVFESPTTERRRHQFVSDSAVVQKEGENWSIYGIPYEKTSANTPAVRTKLSQRAAREEDAKNSRLLEPLGIPYVTASPGAPPFMRAQSATEFQRELEEQRVRKAGGHGHKTSHSLPHVVAVVAHNRTGSGGSISRLRKRRAFTGELQMPPTLASMWESSSTPSSAPPAAFVPSNSGSGGGGGDAVESPSSQKQRFLRMLYSRGGARAGNSGIGNNNGGTDSTGSTTPQLERARTAVPVQVKRSASGPLPVKTSQRPSVSPVAVSEASSVASGEAGTSPLRRATTVSSEAVSSGSEKVHHRQRNRYDFTESSADEDEDESTGPASTPHSLNEYLGLKIDTTISAPQSQQQSQFQSPEKKPSQKSPFSGLASQAAAFQRPPRDRDHEQDPELDLDPRESLECGSSVYSAVRPPMDYSPMNPYVEWTKAAEAPMPDLRTHESDTDEDKSGNLRERIPGQKRSSRQRNELRQSRQDDKRGAQIDAQQQSDPSTARGTRPGITLPRIPALSSTTGGFGRQPPSSIDTEKNNSANTYRVRDTGRSTKKEKPAKNAGEGQIDKPTVQPSIPKSSTEKPRSKQQEQRVKMPARMATPPMDEDDILELYWDRYADDQRLQDLAARQRTTRHQSDVREPSSWDVACREYFVAKYRERLRAENWRNGESLRMMTLEHTILGFLY